MCVWDYPDGHTGIGLIGLSLYAELHSICSPRLAFSCLNMNFLASLCLGAGLGAQGKEMHAGDLILH